MARPSRLLTLARDGLFTLGAASIPFENFFFAPSRGWAAIAPIFFFAYAAASPRELPAAVRRQRGPLLLILAALAVSSAGFLAHPPRWPNLVDAARALALGITFLLALDIRFTDRPDPGPLLRLLGGAYLAAFAVGVVQWAAIRWGLDPLVAAHKLLAKRDVVARGRVQFTFTEPAFASMHVFGVILPLILRFRANRDVARLRWAFAAFVVFGVATRFSVRFVLDAAVVGAIYALCRAAVAARPARAVAATVVVAAVAAVALHQAVPRVRAIAREGVYADGSLAARWFRVHASAVGWADDPVAFLSGYGLSNVWVPMRAGHDRAREAYRSDYRHELKVLASQPTTSALCMHVRVITEFGLLLYLAFVYGLWDRRHRFLSLLVLYVYLPFDSYAFYAVWMHVYFARAAPSDPAAT